MAILPIFVVALVFIAFFYSSARTNANRNFQRVDQAYHSLLSMQDKRISIIDQFSKLWQSDQDTREQIFDNIRKLSKRLKDPDLTKAERNGLHEKMDLLINTAKMTMMGKTNNLSEKQMQLLIASVNEVEEQLSAARRTYHAAVAEYNSNLESFGHQTFASGLGHLPVDPNESTVPESLELGDLPEEEELYRDSEEDQNYFS